MNSEIYQRFCIDYKTRWYNNNCSMYKARNIVHIYFPRIKDIWRFGRPGTSFERKLIVWHDCTQYTVFRMAKQVMVTTSNFLKMIHICHLMEPCDPVTVLNIKCTSRLSCVVDTILSLIDLPVCLRYLYNSRHIIPSGFIIYAKTLIYVGVHHPHKYEKKAARSCLFF
jgi:hypothetical protein